jgi:fatty acid desaturase
LPFTTPKGAPKEYAELKKIVKAEGLMERAVPRYMLWVALVLLAWVASMAVYALVDNFWLLLLNTFFMLMVHAQLGFLGHDFAHKQVFAKKNLNDIFFLLTTHLLVGNNFSWWTATHNAHHANPNHEHDDPDINLPVFAYTREQALEKKGIARFLTKYQAILFMPMMFFVVGNIRSEGLTKVLRGETRYPFWELVLYIVHYVGYVAFFLAVMPWWQALILILIHQGLLGFYLGMTFAPNHKGMPVIPDGMDIGFLRQQVITARNIKPSMLIDFFYGGLNYQIEHHLFPSMPRKNLGRTRELVIDFCKERNIPYVETSVIESYKDILSYFHEVSAVLRQPQHGIEGASAK